MIVDDITSLTYSTIEEVTSACDAEKACLAYCLLNNLGVPNQLAVVLSNAVDHGNGAYEFTDGTVLCINGEDFAGIYFDMDNFAIDGPHSIVEEESHEPVSGQ